MKSKFLTDLCLIDLPGKWWRLAKPLVYYSERIDSTIIVPIGMVSDTASVPRVPIAYWLFGATGNASAVIHDWLYRNALIKRLEADRVFNEALKANGKWAINRWPMVAAVMSFGWAAYDPIPGCLDYRKKNTCGRNCIACDLYYPLWQTCVIKGFVPDIIKLHEEYRW